MLRVAVGGNVWWQTVLTNRKLFVFDLLRKSWCLHSHHGKQLVPKHHDANDAELQHHHSLRHCCLQGIAMFMPDAATLQSQDNKQCSM